MNRFREIVVMSPDEGAGGGDGGGGGAAASMEPSFDMSSMSGSGGSPLSAMMGGQSVPAAADSQAGTAAVPSAASGDEGKYAFDASQLDAPVLPPGGQKPQDTPAVGADGAPAPGAIPEGKPAEGQPAPDAKPAEGEPAPADAPIVIPEATARVLVDAAKMLGIDETDPAKIPAAIEAHNARIAQERDAQEQLAEQEADRAFDQTLREQAKSDAFGLMRRQIADDVKAEMRAAGLPIDTPDWWKNETWDEETSGPNFGDRLKARFDQAFETRRQDYVTRPEWQTAETNAYTARRTAHDTETAKMTEMLGRYEHHAPNLIKDFRRSGADAASVERLAHLTHTHTVRAISTVNSELTQTKAALQQAQQQISGHAAAIEAARLEGRAEAAAVRDQPNPASAGAGSPALAPMNTSSMEPQFDLSSFSNFH